MPALAAATGAIALWPAMLPAQATQGVGSAASVAVDYSYVYFDGDTEPWQLTSLSLGRRTRQGSVIGRVNYANRFGTSGIQLEADAYPKLTDRVYAYLNTGYAPSGVFPTWRFGGEVYANLMGGWEASAGMRELRFDSAQVTLYTGSLGKYAGNYWISLRPFVHPKDDGVSTSANLIARRYFADANHYVGGRLGYGNTPTDRLAPNELARTRSFSAELHAARRVRADMYGVWSVSYDREELVPDRIRNRGNMTMGLRLDF